MKIAHLIFALETGGSENLLVDIANYQIMCHPTSVIIVNEKYADSIVSRLDKRIDVFYLKRKAGSRRAIIFVVKLWAILIKNSISVIHCHNDNLIALLPFFKSKSVFTAHCLKIPITYLNRYNKVFSISHAVASDLKVRGDIQSKVVFNGINFWSFKSKERYNNEGLLKIIQVGRLVHEIKGQDILIGACDELIGMGKKIEVFFVGDGPSRSFLESKVEGAGLTGNIKFLGEKSRQWLFENLQQFHVLVQPSREEGFGLSLIEGIAAGLPVVASDIPGPREVLEDIAASVLFEAENRPSLVKAILRIIDLYEEKRIETLCIASLKVVKEKYSIERTALEYLQSY